MAKKWHKDTLGVRGGMRRTAHDETAEALFLNSGFVYGTAEEAAAAFSGDIDRYIYARYGNPTVTMLQDRLALLEGAEACLAFGTGMAAMFTATAAGLVAGDRIVASHALFGACYAVIDEILPRWGIERCFVDGTDLDAWAAALSTPAKMVFLESPSNPALDLVDIEAVADLAHGAGAVVIVDNVFATQGGQMPLELGADMVMYSLTKHHDGHGRVLGGALLGSDEMIHGRLGKFYRQTGPAISSFNAWVLLKALEDCALRVERMAATAAVLAARLAEHPAVAWVRYPHHPSHPQYDLARRQMSHGGSLLAFELAGGFSGGQTGGGFPGGKEAAFAFLNSLELIDISNNLGDSKTLACHPATTTHSSLDEAARGRIGITDGLMRLSVGLEHQEDLTADLMAALDSLKGR